MVERTVARSKAGRGGNSIVNESNCNANRTEERATTCELRRNRGG